jgi:hypothetical protein
VCCEGLMGALARGLKRPSQDRAQHTARSNKNGIQQYQVTHWALGVTESRQRQLGLRPKKVP